jgi:hypothetical protein
MRYLCRRFGDVALVTFSFLRPRRIVYYIGGGHTCAAADASDDSALDNLTPPTDRRDWPHRRESCGKRVASRRIVGLIKCNGGTARKKGGIRQN